jgi:hypothetical protein
VAGRRSPVTDIRAHEDARASRYWTTRDRAANVRLFRLVAEVLGAIEAGVFHPIVGWQCKDCVFRSKCWAWR